MPMQRSHEDCLARFERMSGVRGEDGVIASRHRQRICQRNRRTGGIFSIRKKYGLPDRELEDASGRCSIEAEEDIDEITDYTQDLGWRQTDQYLAKLEDCFGLLPETLPPGVAASQFVLGCTGSRLASTCVLHPYPENC